MAMTAADRRKKDRERKQRQRAAARDAGKPELAVVNAAITEAVAFTLAGVNIGLREGERATFVNSAQVGRVAIKILVVRLGFDFEHSKKMVLAALAPREEHRWPSTIPSWSHVLGAGSPASHRGSAPGGMSAGQ
jgi:hypothetical protein